MWWRRTALALFLVPLAGCGFQPLYAERGPLDYNPTLASIDVRPATDRLGQIVTEEVRDELNPRGVALPTQYVLKLTVNEQRSDLGIRRDNTSSRGELLINADLTLAPTGGKPAVFHDTLRTTTAFDLSDDAYAATVAEENAREEAAQKLGRDIVLRVDLFLRREAREP